nr:hypothetical protein 6 [bacterium]BDD46703.1 hypothetical protein 14 [Paracoccaceae bacterium]BDD46751.1 hypothetical protein 4 [Paracoccaceae bacterium]
MPNVGDVEYKYGRVYVYVQPNAALGPGTWRVSNPDELAGPGGGGGENTGATYDFDGVPPVDVDMTPGVGNNPTVVNTSLDFVQLDARDS